MKTTRFYKRQIPVLILCAAMCCTFPSYALTTEDRINETASEIEALEDQKEERENDLQDIIEYQADLSGEILELNTQLTSISRSLDELEGEIEIQNQKISEKTSELEAMQAEEQQQHGYMKKRIQYMYENSQSSIFEILIESKSITEFINRTEYAQAVAKYDRNMLSTYEQMVDNIAIDKAELEQEKETLSALQAEIVEQKAQVDALIIEKREKIAQAQAQEIQTQSEIEQYEAEIARQEAYEEQLEAQKIREDAARLEQIRLQEEEDLSGVTITTTEGDETLLAAIIECEAGGESYEGKLAVGSVVLNRVASSSFPNTVVGVIYQSGQFSPVASGRFATALARGASSECVRAAREVLSGTRTLSSLYFRRDTGVISGTVIGHHVFY